ncbi:MAG TPA: DegT/DnrJ/EryC1/StrS aminotransferase family protein [Terriglobia bacterium]|nr:DegT/DnrJ/EryC1/StrS aminotransferase family protein [Terriglobia bacterium]
MTTLSWPLMKNNISRQDLDAVIAFLRDDIPVLTQSRQVQAFEEEWSQWLGIRHSVFVNSGSSANVITIAALRELYGTGEVIVPTLTWVSDIAAVIHAGFQPVFVDIDPRTLGMDNAQVLEKVTPQTKAVFISHILGYNAISDELLSGLAARGVPLIEDACESHGTTFKGKKVGAFGLASNFSFYYAHHLSTIEGGMVSTNDSKLYEYVRMFRSHGMVRESTSQELRRSFETKHTDLTPEFIFAFPGYNMRSTEINAVIGRSQLGRLDENNVVRAENLNLFLDNLDPAIYQTNFERKGNSNYAFTLVLQKPNVALRDKVMDTLRRYGVEFRRGTSGGGNQLRQPYLKKLVGEEEATKYPHVDHVHFFGFYLGNYPGLERDKIHKLCSILNEISYGS